jgi:leucyl aminopeptidase
MIHAVGKASPQAPRLVEFVWGDEKRAEGDAGRQGRVLRHRRLDIKPDSAMLLMKKDMGGAANGARSRPHDHGGGLPGPAARAGAGVENAVSGAAFRPGDVYPSRKGLTVEIGNTDAEGRLILADALALADEERRTSSSTWRR